MKAVTTQRKQLYQLFNYCKDTEALHIQQYTGDAGKKAAADLSVTQAHELIGKLTTNWGHFDKDNGQHKYILSLMRQLSWTRQYEGKVIPDLSKLSNFLKSKRSPVQKPLKAMEPVEIRKIIAALEGIIKSDHK